MRTKLILFAFLIAISSAMATKTSPKGQTTFEYGFSDSSINNVEETVVTQGEHMVSVAFKGESVEYTHDGETFPGTIVGTADFRNNDMKLGGELQPFETYYCVGYFAKILRTRSYKGRKCFYLNENVCEMVIKNEGNEESLREALVDRIENSKKYNPRVKGLDKLLMRMNKNVEGLDEHDFLQLTELNTDPNEYKERCYQFYSGHTTESQSLNVGIAVMDNKRNKAAKSGVRSSAGSRGRGAQASRQ